MEPVQTEETLPETAQEDGNGHEPEAQLPARKEQVRLAPRDMVAGLIPDVAVMEAVWALANKLAKSGAIPKSLTQNKPADRLVADIFAVVMHGAAVGFQPMQALQQICIINGKTTIYGQGIPALLQQHPDFEWMQERDAHDIDEDHPAECTIKRKGQPPCKRVYSYEDARREKLLGKTGPWQQYEKRMMMYKPRNRCANDHCADMLMGLYPHEEALDIVPIRVVNPVPNGGVPQPPDTGQTTPPPQPEPEPWPPANGTASQNGASTSQLQTVAAIYREAVADEGDTEDLVSHCRRYIKRDIEQLGDMTASKANEAIQRLKTYKIKRSAKRQFMHEYVSNFVPLVPEAKERGLVKRSDDEIAIEDPLALIRHLFKDDPKLRNCSDLGVVTGPKLLAAIEYLNAEWIPQMKAKLNT